MYHKTLKVHLSFWLIIWPLGIYCKEQSGDYTHMIKMLNDIKDFSYSQYSRKVGNYFLKSLNF